MGEYNEKIFLKYPPCKQPEQSCVDYDYDPCESSDDITEKDLAILLKEEHRFQREREAEEEEKLRREQELLERKNAIKAIIEPKKPVKKCKKAIKNPFFKNRLDFSTCLPPRPPNPPPQFFPTFDEEEKKCVKKPKKCKKKKVEPLESEHEEEEEEEEETEEEEEEEGEEEEEEALEQPRERRKCRKRYRPPCRKRSSEISGMFQPRRIPAHQRDPPRTSPLEIPEVERQIWLSKRKECPNICGRNNCRVDCRKKNYEISSQSSDNTSDD